MAKATKTCWITNRFLPSKETHRNEEVAERNDPPLQGKLGQVESATDSAESRGNLVSGRRDGRLRAADYLVGVQDSGPAVRVATAGDLNFVIALQKRWSDAVGFLPRAAIEWYVSAGRVVIAEENSAAAGYLLGRERLACSPAVRGITQAAVCFDAQRRAHGLALVAAAAADAAASGRQILQCWCAADLDANLFWRAAAFIPIAVRRPKNARRRKLILWRRPLSELGAAELLHLPRRAGWLARSSAGTRLLSSADLDPSAADALTFGLRLPGRDGRTSPAAELEAPCGLAPADERPRLGFGTPPADL